MWQGMSREDGQRIIHLLVRYISDRAEHGERWVSALEGTDVPLAFVWGMLDPVSGAHMAERIRERLPGAPFLALEDVAHWPTLEAPERVDRRPARRARLLTGDARDRPMRSAGLGGCLLLLAVIALASRRLHAEPPAPGRGARRPRSRPRARLSTPAAATAPFGLSLMHSLGAGNLVLSPDSIAAALAIAGSGAGGATASQMAEGPAPRLTACLRRGRTAAGRHRRRAARGRPMATLRRPRSSWPTGCSCSRALR